MLDLRETTQAKYRCIVNAHLRPRFDVRRLDAITADDLANYVRELRAEGKSEATIAVGLAVVDRICKFAARRLGWRGTIPTTLMLQSERPKVSQAKRRPIFTGEQLEQTIAAAHEPFRALFTVAALTGARISELCALTWSDVRIDDPDDAEIEFGWQVDRHGNRRPAKTDGSARTVPVPSELAVVSLATRTTRGTHRPSATCSPQVPADRSSSATWLERSVRPNGAQSTPKDDPRFPSSMQSTRRAMRSQSRAGRSRRCTRSDTRSPHGRCSPVRASMRSRSSSDIETEPSRGRYTFERSPTHHADRCAARRK